MGFRVQGLGCRDQGAGFRISDVGCAISKLQFMIFFQGLGMAVGTWAVWHVRMKGEHSTLLTP